MLFRSTVDAPDQWHSILGEIAGAVRAKSGLLRMLDLRGDRAVRSSYHHNLDDDLQSAYCAGLVNDDPYLDALCRVAPGRMVTNDRLIDLDALRRTSFYQHYLGPLDNHYVCGGFVQRDTAGRFTILGLHRHRGATQFDDRELQLVQLLSPHVRRAVQLGNLLARESRRADTAEAALDDLSVAAYLLDGDDRVLHANRQGERLLGHGLGVRLRHGQLAARDRQRTSAFASLLEEARRGADGSRPSVPRSLLLPERDGVEPNLLAIAMPVPGDRANLRDSWPDARVAVYLGDLADTGLLQPDLLRALYGMTAAEARLAVALARGRELPELAGDWCVSSDTLRSQLKAVFAKTGVRRQTDLVRLLAGAPWKLATTTTREAH